MKKILLLIGLVAVAFTSCMKDELYIPSPKFDKVTYNTPGKITAGTAAIVIATVTNANTAMDDKVDIAAVALCYNGEELEMTKQADGTYQATIPASVNSVDGVKVNYTIKATNVKGETTLYSGSYTVGELMIDYTQLVLNEVCGAGSDAEKFIEIYNKSNDEISLDGVKTYYNGALNYACTSSNKIAGKGYFVILGRATVGGMMLTGLSANNVNITLELKDPNGGVIDTYKKLTAIVDPGLGAFPFSRSHARIPDGTGVWYITTSATGTRGATNGNSSTGYMLLSNYN